MKPAAKYWVFLLVIAVVVFSVILGSFLGSWYSLDPAEQRGIQNLFTKLLPFPLLGAALLFGVIGGLVSLLFHFYIIPILQLAEKTRLISAVNAQYRIVPKGAKEVVQLAGIINESAAALQRLQVDVEVKIGLAQQQLSEERTRLAALMSELPNGVLVCNPDGLILLYNPQARKLLQGPKRLVGLGRSIFGILERGPLLAALEVLQRAAESGEVAPVADFMMTLDESRQLRLRMAPVFSLQEQRRLISGIVLTLDDLSPLRELDSRREAWFAALLANLQSALDALRRGCGPMTPLQQCDQSPVLAAADSIGEQLRQARDEYARLFPPTGWQEPRTKEGRPPGEGGGREEPRQVHVDLAPHRPPRPVYYAFDLFQQPAVAEWGRQSLRNLTYVVFDTETTGLNPAEGDEIVQLGAIRIVNGRLLFGETLDQLVDPGRSLPEDSSLIHGIWPEMLRNQPSIGEVLPHFHHFAEGAVLVAHNAAFDMRLLQLKETLCGLRFDNPVLDTLLLSSVVHPHHKSHSLEGIAERLNLTIVGRHTALGDAIVTAEVFLKLIPLLEAQGIHTLEEALKASRASVFAKLKY